MGPILSVKELRQRLLAANQPISAPADDVFVIPSPDTIVNVSAGCDPVLYPEWRNRYFVCLRLRESDYNSALCIQHDPAFALPKPFRAAAEQSSSEWDFQQGPFRWLIQRLLRFG
jgi:hypothetical protein